MRKGRFLLFSLFAGVLFTACTNDPASENPATPAASRPLLIHAADAAEPGVVLLRFRENYADRSTELVKIWFASMQQKHPEINTAVSDFIIHLHTVWMFTMFEELLMHSVPRQEMEAILHDYILFEIQGWRAIIKI
mgnify:CR=1 FL=1